MIRLIKMTGGLGNQMFIYAFYLRLTTLYKHVSIDLSDMVHYNVHNGYEMHRVFNLPNIEFCINQPLKKVLEFLFFQTLLERKQKGVADMLRPRKWPLIYYKGFYQTEKYFKPCEDLIRSKFRFNDALVSASTRRMMEQIDEDSKAVSLHIRRGDYLNPRTWENIGCVCQLPYYLNAIKEMASRVENPHFYVFSDDLEWVKANLSLPGATYIDWNHGADSWQDMLLMSHCRHHIICNSTFSWWGAWLNARKDKVVIAPERWYARTETPDICPEQWLKVSVKPEE